MTQRFELPFIEVPPGTNAVDLLAAHSQLSKTQIKDAMAKGAVWLLSQGRQRRLRRAKSELRPGDKIALFYDARILDTTPPTPALFDDQGGFSVWSKPAGLLSAGSRFGDHCAINRVVGRRLDRETFIVHRLDQFAWGLMVLAHDKQSAAAIAAQFEARSVDKTYQAIVHGQLRETIVVESPIDGKSAHSIITPLTDRADHTLVSISISTGRKHQIRIHLAGAGFPIVGDRQYGSADGSDLQLAAVELAFSDPKSDGNRRYSLPEPQRPTLGL